ncbi:uncharacterized protein FTOL_13937 [Fusarium torulosum]|uniref:Uncharacterized protein n=1 Tax=Fusarium torulosum TaxID=33205 RepID=A0AAE8SQB5_9HYPO|nr:uncharacterized protein FTOL_13937 [Fusarium torulosum]
MRLPFTIRFRVNLSANGIY